MLLQETIFCATAAANAAGTTSLHDIQTGNTLATFKQTNAAPHCTAFIESKNGQGGLILAAQPDKSLLNVYAFQKDQLHLKIVLPEKLTCIALDPQGVFCAGGTAQGRIYFWEIASGILYNSWDAHYRQVAVLRFTSDGAALLSGSEDSGVSVWSVSRLVEDGLQNDLPIPFSTLSDHTLPVTDIVCGIGSFPNCRVITASLDHTTKLWDLSSRSLLITFLFPQPISCLAWDPTERIFFAASMDGSIHQVNLFRQKEGGLTEAIGGTNVSEIIRATEAHDTAPTKRLIAVGQPITAISISLTSSLLLVGTQTGLIHVYDIMSHQLLRTVSTHKGLSVTSLATILKPPDLIGHLQFSSPADNTSDAIPIRPIVPFQRMKDIKTREIHEISILLPAQKHTKENDGSIYDDDYLRQDHAFFVEPSQTADTDGTNGLSLKTKIEDLESEVSRLREQLGKAKSVNDVMWDTVVQSALTLGDAKEVGDSSDGERKQKRGRM